MEIFQNYKNYKKFENDYALWKQNKDITEAKRLEYLRQNPVDDLTKKSEIQRGKALLHAIDVMDEYSQTKAENMEIATEQIVAQAGQVASYAGMGLGAVISFSPPVQKLIDKIIKKCPKMATLAIAAPTAIITGLFALGATIVMQAWAAKKQVGASRNGRFEAMKNELADPKNFAILTPEQLAKQEAIVKTIPTTKDMKRGIVAKKSNMLNPLTLFKTVKDAIFNDKKLEHERIEFDKKLNTINDKGVVLSEADILKAQKDKQLLHNIVEKIDMASQDYAENIELATDTASAVALGGGFLTGFLANALSKLLKIKNPIIQKGIGPFAGLITTLAIAIGATRLQKEGARVGRYLAKKELEKNLDNFVYVDEKLSDKLTDYTKTPSTEKKNIFAFLWQAIKDNREYKKYIKTQGVENIKKSMALKEIELTPEQLKEAKTLQKNTFKTFNKIDEKSQAYAESVEAVKSIIELPVAFLGGSLGAGIGALISLKMFKCIKNVSPLKAQIPIMIGTFIGILPTIFLNAHFTKEQRKASRVAHMLALNEINDAKSFVDYDNLTLVSPTPSRIQNKSREDIINNWLKNNFY